VWQCARVVEEEVRLIKRTCSLDVHRSPKQLSITEFQSRWAVPAQSMRARPPVRPSNAKQGSLFEPPGIGHIRQDVLGLYELRRPAAQPGSA
jgi:hypothetical protein